MFHPGELVTCINPEDYEDLEIGETYTVKGMSPQNEFVYIEEIKGGFFPWRFKSASPKKETLSLEDML